MVGLVQNGVYGIAFERLETEDVELALQGTHAASLDHIYPNTQLRVSETFLRQKHCNLRVRIRLNLSHNAPLTTDSIPCLCKAKQFFCV